MIDVYNETKKYFQNKTQKLLEEKQQLEEQKIIIKDKIKKNNNHINNTKIRLDHLKNQYDIIYENFNKLKNIRFKKVLICVLVNILLCSLKANILPIILADIVTIVSYYFNEDIKNCKKALYKNHVFYVSEALIHLKAINDKYIKEKENILYLKIGNKILLEDLENIEDELNKVNNQIINSNYKIQIINNFNNTEEYFQSKALSSKKYIRTKKVSNKKNN